MTLPGVILPVISCRCALTLTLWHSAGPVLGDARVSLARLVSFGILQCELLEEFKGVLLLEFFPKVNWCRSMVRFLMCVTLWRECDVL